VFACICLKLTCATESVNNVFERIAGNEQLFALRTGLVMFFKHYMREFTVGLGAGGAPANSLDEAGKVELLHKRLRLAKMALSRGPAGLAF
jgi:hypothetical protein